MIGFLLELVLGSGCTSRAALPRLPCGLLLILQRLVKVAHLHPTPKVLGRFTFGRTNLPSAAPHPIPPFRSHHGLLALAEAVAMYATLKQWINMTGVYRPDWWVRRARGVPAGQERLCPVSRAPTVQDGRCTLRPQLPCLFGLRLTHA